MIKPFVLAVDDDPMNLDIVRNCLEELDLEIRFAASGDEALQWIDRQSVAIDLVILDRMMPGMNGLEVLRRIKANGRTARTPVVMQTAAASQDEVEEGLRAGAYYYLTKPYSPASLRTIVRSALEDGALQREFEVRSHEHAALYLTQTAAFVIRTLDEATELATLLAALCPNPSAAQLGLSELLVNAIEHGNLTISYDDKLRLREQGRWREEVERRQELPEYRQRRVRVAFEREPHALRFVIADEGSGFAWRSYLEFDPARAFDPNGRGIALANAMSFTSLHYEGRGNVAVARVALD